MDLSKFTTKAQGLIEKASDLSEHASHISGNITSTLKLIGRKSDNDCSEEPASNLEKGGEYIDSVEVSIEEQEERGSKMLQVMEWAFEKANGNIPGFGTSEEMAKKYLDKYGSVNKAIDKLVNWQITSAATAGFVTNLGGVTTMPFTLPANVAGVMAIQLRMIGAIAELGGFHENTEEKKTGMYLCLLGSQAGDVLSKTASKFAVKFAEASLKKLPGTILTKINQQVGFRLLTKFGKQGLLNVNKAIPVLGGVVGGAVDAFSTYAIAKAAKALFLDEIIEFEKQEQLEIEKVHLLINLARIDSRYDEEEKTFIKYIADGLNISRNGKEGLYKDIENPKKFNVDLEVFKSDLMLSTSTLYALVQVAKLGGMSPVEDIYIRQLGQQMGCDESIINKIIE